MPKPLTQNDDSDNDFSSANENSNLSEISPLAISAQANLLRQASQLSATASAFNQNSSSSTSSLININANTQINNSSQNSNASSASANKKFRHQNFSKNIYIGTKNAERWDNLRNLFQFKNDVEFVSFLLTTAENEARSNKNGYENDFPLTLSSFFVFIITPSSASVEPRLLFLLSITIVVSRVLITIKAWRKILFLHRRSRDCYCDKHFVDKRRRRVNLDLNIMWML